jgi:hypothetical protein
MHEISSMLAKYMYDTIMGDMLDMNSSYKNSKGRFRTEFLRGSKPYHVSVEIVRGIDRTIRWDKMHFSRTCR